MHSKVPFCDVEPWHEVSTHNYSLPISHYLTDLLQTLHHGKHEDGCHETDT